MRISKTLCEESTQMPLDAWTVEGRLRTSDIYEGVTWGTCSVCGKKHYNAPFNDSVKKNIVAFRVTNKELNEIITKAKQNKTNESAYIRTIIFSSVKELNSNTLQQ